MTYRHRHTVTVEPATEPVSLSELKNHLKVSNAVDDALITNMGKAARIFIEGLTDKKLITQTVVFYIDNLTDVKRSIYLPISPVTGVTFEYISSETNDLSYTVFDSANYILDSISLYPRISLRNNSAYPSTANEVNAIKITIIAGYGTAADVPEDYKIAIMELVAEMYENRENRTYTFGSSGYRVPTHINYLLANKIDSGFFVE